MLWYYYFFLENQNDAPYTVTMAPYNPGNTPASPDLGHEIDLTATWTFTPRTAILFGYSHFFSGEYYKQTPGADLSRRRRLLLYAVHGELLTTMATRLSDDLLAMHCPSNVH